MRTLRLPLAVVVTALLAGSGAAVAAARAAHSVTGRAWGGTHIQTMASATSAEVTEPTPPAPGATAQISDESKATWWGHVVRRDVIYATPSWNAKVLGRLHHFTEDGFSEVYLVLAEYRDPSNGFLWVKTRIPGRPNGREGWTPRSGLGPLHFTNEHLVVARHQLRIILYRGGHRVWSAPVAIGKPSTPTPAGQFWIRERFKITDRKSGYWPYAMGTADYSTLTDWPGGGVVGIHGPYFVPNSAIPGRISHGCIRLRTWDMSWLAHHVDVGTPLTVTR